jgi:GntR family transcriptional regulator, transcriptional repressor for pyruvate dehydrogenase complex
MTLQIEKFERRESPSTEVARKILDFLLASDYKPGAKLPSERQLAASLAIGRSSVRDALRPLVWLGIIEVRQGDGTYLRSLSSETLPKVVEWGLLLGDERVLDLVEARHSIETATVRLAAERRTEAEIADLDAAVRRLEAAIVDEADWVDADINFHVTIASIARNSVLHGILTNIQSLLRYWIEEASRSDMALGRALEIHAEIAEAIAAGDGDRAVSAMSEHLVIATERLVDTLHARGSRG